MKKQVLVLALAVLGTMPLLGRAQQAAQADPDVEAFDKRVAAAPSIAKPIEITLDVIGFDIRKGSKEEKELGDVASAGSGKYFPVANAQDLARVFTQVTTGVAMGGGGGIVLPAAAGPSALFVGSIILLLGALILALGILLVRKRRAEGEPVPPRRSLRREAGVRVSASLAVVYADGGRKTVMIRSERTTIGRREDCAVVIHDALASGAHAEIIAGPEGFVLRDLGSANGTLLNGQPVNESPVFLGDRIVIGTTTLTLEA